MIEKRLNTGPNPHISLEMVAGDLQISGWDAEEVLAVATEDALELEQADEKVSIHCDSDLTLSLPRGATLTIEFVGGNALLSDLHGPTVIEQVAGDLVMQNVTQAKVEPRAGNAPADFSARLHRKISAAVGRAERKAAAAARRVERKMRYAERHGRHLRAEMHIGPWKWDFASGGPTAKTEPVTDEERMAILRMLQEKKISAEEAEKLLAALEGRGG